MYQGVGVEKLNAFLTNARRVAAVNGEGPTVAVRPRILVVDDEPDMLDVLALHLTGAGMEVSCAASGTEALAVMAGRRFDLAVLDIRMDDIDGLEVLRRLREGRNEIPVILLSAWREDEVKVRGFGLGADDYVTKPFSPVELVARVRAHLRRAQRVMPATRPVCITCGPFTLDPEAQVIRKGDVPVPLSELETRLLLALLRRPGQVIGKMELFAEVWGHEGYDANSLNVYVNRVRRKIEDDPQRPRYLAGAGGLGWRGRLHCVIIAAPVPVLRVILARLQSCVPG